MLNSIIGGALWVRENDGEVTELNPWGYLDGSMQRYGEVYLNFWPAIIVFVEGSFRGLNVKGQYISYLVSSVLIGVLFIFL